MTQKSDINVINKNELRLSFDDGQNSINFSANPTVEFGSYVKKQLLALQ